MLKTTSIQVSKNLHNELRTYCKKNGLKMQWLVEKLIKEELNGTKKED